MLSVEWQPFCLCLNVLTHCHKVAKAKSIKGTYGRNVGFFDAGDGIFWLASGVSATPADALAPKSYQCISRQGCVEQTISTG